MSNPEQANEPTMEEILASIRRIISDDDRQQAENAAGIARGGEAEESGPATAAQPAEAPAQAAAGGQEADDIMAMPVEQSEAMPAGEPEVLELTEETGGGDDVFALGADSLADAGEGAGAAEDGDVVFLDKREDELDEAFRAEAGALDMSEPEPESEPDTAAWPEPESAPSVETVAPAAEQREAPGRLLSDRQGQSVQSAFATLENFVMSTQSRTLEDLVTDMLRPMLRDWLDANLPPLVERLVREEIERVSRGRR